MCKLKAMKNINGISLMMLFGSSKGSSVEGAGIYLETGTEQKLVAFQKTGESGKATFAYLDKGVYRILLDIPRQTGKLEVKEVWSGDIQVGYHSEKKWYMFQELSGYFLVRFTRLSNLANSNITPMYELDENQRRGRIIIGKLEVEKKFGSLTLELLAHTQKKFFKLTDKYKNDAGMSVIRKSR